MANKSSWNALVFMLVLIGTVGVMALSPRETVTEKTSKKLNKPAIKFIKRPNGDIVDCVDIYKQPAFDHPLLKNHTIEMRPSFSSKKVEKGNYSEEFSELWARHESCPKGTIPIQRVLQSDIIPSESLEIFGAVYPNPIGSRRARLEIAGATAVGRPSFYNGAHGIISIWNPTVRAFEHTDSMIHVSNGVNYISVGYMVISNVHPIAPRLTVAYGNGNEGCVNLRCPGFVQTNHQIVLGDELTPSMRGHDTSNLNVKIQKNTHWDVSINGVEVGYYHCSVVGFCQANNLKWVGRVYNAMVHDEHTTTQMGSGWPPNEGYGKSAHFQNIHYYDRNNLRQYAANRFRIVVDYPHCYNAILIPPSITGHGPTIFYGGPGGRACDET